MLKKKKKKLEVNTKADNTLLLPSIQVPLFAFIHWLSRLFENPLCDQGTGLDIGDAPVKKTKNLTLGSTNLVMETGRLSTC